MYIVKVRCLKRIGTREEHASASDVSLPDEAPPPSTSEVEHRISET
jgi:hypothetical protein